MRQTRILGLVTVALMPVLAACGAHAIGPGSEDHVELEVPDMAIVAYQGQDELGGEEVRLSEVVGQGRPVVLNFWAALCPPCRAEMPDFQRVHEARGQEVMVLGVDVGPQLHLGSREQGRALLRELGITYPAGTSFNETIARDFGIRGMPTTLFIHANGQLARNWTGLLNEAKINELIDNMLASGR